ncbi:hypothetical protein C8R44DRAFT_891457 [Mycena epipterygia]|nr:hypothetical protein C8R44DRAFT_891457 [Mycena epipterygia]
MAVEKSNLRKGDYSATYGIEIQEEDGAFIFFTSGKSLQPRARQLDNMSGFPADVFPLLLYIPALLGPFKLTARPWALAANNMVEAPYLFVRRCRECDNLLRVEASEDEQMGNEEAARSLYVFFLAIFLAPGATIFAFFSIPPLKKLRATRYPTPWAGRVAFPDREHLLYVSALVTEHRSVSRMPIVFI